MVDLLPRVIAKIAFGDCWEWTGGTSAGYGVVKIDASPRHAYRYVWEVLVGPIPPGMQLDHLCRNRRCCNPDHLEVVTQKINTLRGFGAGAVNAKRNVCPQGHPYDTLLRNGNGISARSCKRCNNEKSRRYQVRKAAVSW